MRPEQMHREQHPDWKPLAWKHQEQHQWMDCRIPQEFRFLQEQKIVMPLVKRPD